MENLGGFSFNEMNQTMRKKRSNRRSRNEFQQENENSSLSSSPPSNNGSKGLSDDNVSEKVLNLNQCNSSRASNVSSESKIQESSDDKDTNDTLINSGHSSGSLELDPNAGGVDNVVKKVKLKFGGVIRTLHTKSSKQKLISQENPDQDFSNVQHTGSGLRGIPWKDFSKIGFHVGKKNSEKQDAVNKNKRVPKRPVLDNDDEDDAELRYLAKMKLKSTKFDGENEDEDEGGSKKKRKISSVLKMENKRKSKIGKEYEDNDYTGEENLSADIIMVGEESSREMTVTTRRQALQSGRDVLNASGVEFPHGLPPAPPRKQKEKLSEVEHQLKKAEAAERRRIQAAKAARESEAEAIRKILGQDSSRKKRENKMKQRQEELAQERSSNAATLASNTVRWVIRPTGTVVTFSDDVGLPNIFKSTPSSYPGPREKCAGPSCSKPFKYRDSRSKLPLCSLQCYKAVQHPGAVY